MKSCKAREKIVEVRHDRKLNTLNLVSNAFLVYWTGGHSTLVYTCY